MLPGSVSQNLYFALCTHHGCGVLHGIASTFRCRVFGSYRLLLNSFFRGASFHALVRSKKKLPQRVIKHQAHSIQGQVVLVRSYNGASNTTSGGHKASNYATVLIIFLKNFKLVQALVLIRVNGKFPSIGSWECSFCLWLKSEISTWKHPC